MTESQGLVAQDQDRIGRRFNLRQIGERGAVPGILLLLIITFTFLPATSKFFLTPANIQNIVANQAVTGLIALGMVIPLVAGYFDLSVAAIAGLSNVTVAALLATYQMPIGVAVAAGVLVGAIAGAANGILVGVLRLSPFIATFGTYIVIGGLLQVYTNGQIISNGMPASFGDWFSGKWFGLARPFWILLIAAVLIWYLLVNTPFGRKLAAMGSNESAARLAGIRVDRSVFTVFVLSGVVAGLAGVVLTARSGSADSQTALTYLFPALAAVFLGQTAITPGRYNVWGTIFGVFLVAVAVNGFTLLGANSSIAQLFNGVALLAALFASSFIARARERKARRRAVEIAAAQWKSSHHELDKKSSTAGLA